MCCFAQYVLNVTDTKIFARLTSPGMQVLAYEMTYESAEPNAMALPLPTDATKGESAVRFVSLEDFEHFFSHLERGFPRIPRMSIGCSESKIVTSSRGAIEVHQVGDYIASFVPSLADFDRLDPRFVIPKETWNLIPQYKDYGFAVFQLKQLAGKPHPMALEFASRWNDRVFFPTVHIHDGEVHAAEAFDHMLYMQHAQFDSVVGGYVDSDIHDPSTEFVRSKEVASGFADVIKSNGLIAGDLLVHRKEMRGLLANQDQILTIAGDPLVPHFNPKHYKRLAPWGVAAAACAWFLARRGRLKKSAMAVAKD
ncbi:MAG TPA: hypothetical protein DDZ51_16490 [Planctomycetaceae bacterium]|nr:hypothetical protein [Planctomycetaceae bacterium]